MKNNEFKLNDYDVDEHEKQMLQLTNDILKGVSKWLFRIYNNECGTGKTLTSHKAIAEAAVNGRRIIFVRPGKRDTEHSAMSINKHAKALFSIQRTNLKVGNIAIAINSDNFSGKEKQYMKDIILKSPVVVITHSKYKIISKGIEDNLFQSGRDTLIIDEKIEMVVPIEISLNHLKRFEGRLIPKFRDEFVKMTNELLFTLENHGNQMKMFRPKNKSKIVKKLESLKVRISADEIKKEHLKYLAVDWDKESNSNKNSNYHLDFLSDLILLFTGPTVITKGSNAQVIAATFDPKINYWMLENNIILDANGGFDQTYELSNLFDKKNLPLITDHAKWTLFLSTLNTIKSKKKEYENFYDIFNLFTLDHKDEYSGILVVGNKYEITNNKFVDHHSDNIKLNYMGNMSGINHYRAVPVGVILSTFQLPLYVLVLQYLYYTGLKDINDRLLETKPDKKNSFGHSVLSFKFNELEQLRVSNTATHLYQAIKRINRDNSKPAKVYLTLHDEKVFDVVKRQMMNVKIEVWNHSPVSLLEKHKKKNFLVDELILLLENLDYGFITKKELKSILYAGKSDTTKASINSGFSKIVKDDRLKRYCKENNIEITTRNFIKHRENIA